MPEKTKYPYTSSLRTIKPQLCSNCAGKIEKGEGADKEYQVQRKVPRFQTWKLSSSNYKHKITGAKLQQAHQTEKARKQKTNPEGTTDSGEAGRKPKRREREKPRKKRWKARESRGEIIYWFLETVLQYQPLHSTHRAHPAPHPSSESVLCLVICQTHSGGANVKVQWPERRKVHLIEIYVVGDQD